MNILPIFSLTTTALFSHIFVVFVSSVHDTLSILSAESLLKN